MIEPLLERFAFDPSLAEAARRATLRCLTETTPAALATAYARANVLRAFYDEGLAESDLAGTLGYGYDDAARGHYESLLARIFGAERAFARLSLVSGTHAIATAIDACLPHQGRLISATGRPYDTLRNALVDAPYALARRGARYSEIALAEESGNVDLVALARACERGVDVVFIQRSRGYAARRALSAAECGAVAKVVRSVASDAFVLVDNCYGELVDATEPTHHGVDAVMGSLIKNLGGALAPGGGYVIGRAEVVDRVAARHYAPGLGTGVGSTLGFGRALIQGLFAAPSVVAECLAGLDLAAALFDEVGERCDPLPLAERHDIVQAIALGSAARVIAFARGLQRAMPLNARFAPVPGNVPGYRDPVIMSGGAFVNGATIELSCDAPLRAPYEVYLQGGASREHVLLGAMFAAEALSKESK